MACSQHEQKAARPWKQLPAGGSDRDSRVTHRHVWLGTKGLETTTDLSFHISIPLAVEKRHQVSDPASATSVLEFWLSKNPEPWLVWLRALRAGL